MCAYMGIHMLEITLRSGKKGPFAADSCNPRCRKTLSSLCIGMFFLAYLFPIAMPASAGIFYVNAASTAPTPDGQSWETAYKDIQSAVDAASAANGGEVWVAGGTYTSSSDFVLTMKEQVEIYGGFEGTETSREGRNWKTQVTTINGEKTRSCVAGANQSTIDGFTFTAGTFFNNSTSPRICNCIFTNIANHVLYNYDSSSVIINCIFTDNQYNNGLGGVISNYKSAPVLVNCLFMRNSAKQGGAVYNDNSAVSFTNCTFVNNTGGAMLNDDSEVTITNCIIWGNTSGIAGKANVNSSCIQGGHDGQANTDQNPRFWDIASNDVRLHATSPCLNTGTQAGAPDIDLSGTVRPQGAGIDMGVYEMNEPDSDGDGLMDMFEVLYSHTDPAKPDSDGDTVLDGALLFNLTVWHVKAGSSVSNPDGATWESAYPDIQSAVDAASTAGGGEVWVAAGTYTSTSSVVVAMKAYVDIYGGFSGNETIRDERDVSLNISLIDGETSRPCVQGANQALLDGFTISHAQTGIDNNNNSPIIKNCLFIDNTTGIINATCASVIINCSFINNTEYGIYASYAYPTISQCHFENSGYFGVDSWWSHTTINNCSFHNNHWGGLHAYQSQLFAENCSMLNSPSYGAIVACTGTRFTNCTFAGNGVSGIETDSLGSTDVVNCIIWDNKNNIVGEMDITYSCVQEGHDGVGNIATDPLFWNIEANDVRLHGYSPCLNSGTSSGAPSSDIRGVPRPYGANVDMGCYEQGSNDIDSDGDGLLDEFERQYSRTNPNDRYSIGDGYDDFEYWLYLMKVWRVDVNQTTHPADGLTWETAYPDIQTAIGQAAVHGGGEVWVSQGTYTSGNDTVIRMRRNVNIYGGFSGVETHREDRDWLLHETVIDGEKVHYAVIGGNQSTIDGLVITGGTETESVREGAAMFTELASPIVENCTFRGNVTGMKNESSEPTIRKCIFEQNSFTGINNNKSEASIMNTLFRNNGATYSAGGVYNYFSRITAINCIFSNNSCMHGLGIIDSSTSGATIHSSVFYNNRKPANAKINISDLDTSLKITNSIFMNNDTLIIRGASNSVDISYSCLQEAQGGDGNIVADPMFICPEEGDFHLLPESPCIDAGTKAGAPAQDFAGMPRRNGSTCDMGAYEYPYGNEQGCAQGSLFAELPVLDGVEFQPLWSGFSAAMSIYENIDIPRSLITGLRWWGGEMDVDSGNPCVQEDTSYRIQFYRDNLGEPGALLSEYAMVPQKVFTGWQMQSMDHAQRIYQYEVALPTPVSTLGGTTWLTIYKEDADPCSFFWNMGQGHDSQSLAAFLDEHGQRTALIDQPVDPAICVTGTYLPVPQGALRGAITTIAGNATVSCATVSAMDEMGEAHVGVADAGGNYRIEGLADGDYAITVYAPGMAMETDTVTISQGSQEVRNYAMTPLAEDAAVSGVVTDTVNSQHLGGVRVDMLVNGTVIATTYTCANGMYAFVREPGLPGEVTLRFSGGGYTTHEETAVILPDEPVLINVSFAVAMEPSDIKGYITSGGYPLPGVVVTASAGGVLQTAVTSDGGKYTLSPIVPFVTYQIHFNAACHLEEVQTITPDYNGAYLNLSLTRDDNGECFAGSVQGVVTNRLTGQALDGVLVEAIQIANGHTIGSAITDEEGFYLIDGINPYLPQLRMKYSRREFISKQHGYAPPEREANETLDPVDVAHPPRPVAHGGVDAAYVNWATNVEYNLKGYHVWRREAIPGSNLHDFSTWSFGNIVKQNVTLVRGTTFEDEYDASELGRYYQYQVIAVSKWDNAAGISNDLDPEDPAHFLYWSDPVQAGTVVLSMPENQVVAMDQPNPWLWDQDASPDPNFPFATGQWVRIPIAVDSAYDVSGAMMTITIQVPVDLLYADAGANLLVRATDLTESMEASAEAVEDGIVVITATGQAGSLLYGCGALFDLFLQVRNAGGCVDGLNLHLLDPLEYPEQGTVLYDAAGAPINLDLQDGALCFEPGDNCRLGDVNEDDVINLEDFTHILHLTVEPELLTPCSQWAGDLYVDGLVNAQDANRLGRWLAGESMVPVKGMPWPVSVQSTVKAGSVALVRMGDVFAAEDQTEVEVPLLIDTASSALPLWGFEADLAYPVSIAGANHDDGLVFSSLTLGGTPVVVDTATSSINAIEDAETGYGLLRVAVAGIPDMGAKASVPVFAATFHAGADLDRAHPIPVTLKRFVYHDVYGYAPLHGAPGTPVIAGQVPGDVTMDGVANYKDASWILQAAVGLRTLDGEANGDVTGDGVVNYKDASWILQAAVGLRTL